MKKSAAAKLHTRNLGTSILLLANISTNTTVPFPNMANKNTTHTPHLNVHQSKRSWHGKNGPIIKVLVQLSGNLIISCMNN